MTILVGLLLLLVWLIEWLLKGDGLGRELTRLNGALLKLMAAVVVVGVVGGHGSVFSRTEAAQLDWRRGRSGGRERRQRLLLLRRLQVGL